MKAENHMPWRISLAALLAPVFVLLAHSPCSAYLQGLTAREKAMPEAGYFDPTYASLPEDVSAALSAGPIPSCKALKFEEINELLEPGYLEVENGYCLNPDGTGFVAVKTDFPGATGDMVRWWFWWHAFKNVRYKIWCPGSHFAISVHDMDRMLDPTLSYEERYLNNPQYPVEDTGTGYPWMSIRFVEPEAFGFDTSRFEAAGIDAVVCAVVGYRFAGITAIRHTCMVHLFRRTDAGLELRSRFWVGKALSPFLRRFTITLDTARSIAFHCATEYNHLAGFLPEIYEEFK
jgi:hypothetical protein